MITARPMESNKEMAVTAFRGDGTTIEAHHEHEVLRIEPWGRDSVRVRAALGHLPESDAGAPKEPPPGAAPEVHVTAGSACLVTWEFTVEVATPA